MSGMADVIQATEMLIKAGQNAAAICTNSGLAIILEKHSDALRALIARFQLFDELLDAVRPALTEEGMTQIELDRLRAAFARLGGDL